MQPKNTLVSPNAKQMLWFLGLIPFVVMHNISAVFIQVRGVAEEQLGLSALGYFSGVVTSALILYFFRLNMEKGGTRAKVWRVFLLAVLLLPGLFSLAVPFFVENSHIGNPILNTVQPFLWALFLPVAFRLFFNPVLAGLYGLLFGMSTAIGHLCWALLLPIINSSAHNIQASVGDTYRAYLPFLNTMRCIFGIAFALIAWRLLIYLATHNFEQKTEAVVTNSDSKTPDLSLRAFWFFLLPLTIPFFLYGVMSYISVDKLVLHDLNIGYMNLSAAILILFVGFWVTNSGYNVLKTVISSALFCLATSLFLVYFVKLSFLPEFFSVIYNVSYCVLIFAVDLVCGYFLLQSKQKVLIVIATIFATSFSIPGNFLGRQLFISISPDPLIVVCIFTTLCFGFILLLRRSFPVLAVVFSETGKNYSNPTLYHPEMMPRFSKLHKLTAREVQIMDMLLNGFSTGEMVEILGLKENTIRTYTQTLLKKTQTNSRLGLVAAFLSSKDSE